MATHAFTTPTVSSPIADAIRSALTGLGRLWATSAADTQILALCTDFHRHHATLAATPYEDEPTTDAAYTARQNAADRLATMCPQTDAGRRAKAAVGVTLLEEVAPWQRDSEWQFAAAAFRAEARA